jgi:hypothetical protein
MSTTTKPFDLVGFIMAFEGGEVSEEELVEGFQHLIDTGQAWTLQGFYGRTAAALIEAGLCSDPRKPNVRPELIGTRCECGAPYDAERGGYSCAR